MSFEWAVFFGLEVPTAVPDPPAMFRHVCLPLMAALCIAGVGAAQSADGVLAASQEFRERGEFEKATQQLRAFLDDAGTTLPPSERRTVEFELERMRRIRKDYTTTRERLLETLQRRVPDFRAEELDAYERQGFLDSLTIDGQKFYVDTSASNLFNRDRALARRRPNRQFDGTMQKLYRHMKQAEAARDAAQDAFVLPQDFAVTYTLVVKPGAVPAGRTVRAWLPYARAFPYQTDAVVLTSDPTTRTLAPSEWAHRTVYLEKLAEADQPTTFSVSFIYRSWSQVHRLTEDQIKDYDKSRPEYQFYTAERKPHLDLNHEVLRQLNSEIVGSETHPLRVARRIYDWISRETIYQYAREYSTIDNLAVYTAQRRGGDCGQHGMLFIALCRMNGIPARWATGWQSFEARRNNNMHDWSEVYFEPVGWVPVDVDYAQNVFAFADDELTTVQMEELASWFFGNMDHFRLTINADWGMPLFPEKNDFRSETVDFQRGEVEYDDTNLYFDQWNWSMRIEPVGAAAADRLRSAGRPAAPVVEFPEWPAMGLHPAATPAPLPDAPESTSTAATETTSTP